MAISEEPRSDAGEQAVTAILDDRSSTIELAVAGKWNIDLWRQAHRTARKCLTSHPAGLLVDLLRLGDPHAASVPIWFNLQAQAHRMTPTIPVAVCVRGGSALAGVLDRFGARYRLPLFGSRSQARLALAACRPTTDRIVMPLPAEPGSVATARQIVTAACHEWGLSAVVPRAQLVASELVTNALEHTGTAVHLTVTRLGSQYTKIVRRHNGVHVAVRDHDPCLPAAAAPPAPQRLRVVEATADHWGALPTGRGKVVWAALRDRP